MTRRKKTAPTTEMKPTGAVGYVRVSTDKQEHGPEVQEQAIKAWCEREGIPLLAIHQEVVSGGVPLDERQVLVAALDSLAPGQVLVAHKRDRLARDVAASALITKLAEDKGACIMTTDGANAAGPEGELMRLILDAFAQYERALIRARTRAALGKKRAAGELCGSTPYGWRVGPDGVKLEHNPAEQQVIARVVAMRGDGATLQGIIDALDAEGIAPRGKGGRWHKTTIMRIAEANGIPSPRGRGRPAKGAA